METTMKRPRAEKSEKTIPSKKAKKSKKLALNDGKPSEGEELEEVPLTRKSEEEETTANKCSKWRNKQRVLVLGCRGLSHRDRHLMDDLKNMMPHAKGDSKMQRKESLFVVNEIAEMKNCNKCLLFEGRRKGDLYMWAANVARGPSAKFQVENIHTQAELKMTGNCLKSSRPLLSFGRDFDTEPHYKVVKELMTQIFSIPRSHPKSQPFFDHVYTFTVVDNKIWFRNYQIVDESGSLAEIGPRFVLNPIKVFEASFAGQTLWDNPKFISPAASRAMLRKARAGKYAQHVQSKAAYEAARPTESTYAVDDTDQVFETIADAEDSEDGGVSSHAAAAAAEALGRNASRNAAKNKKKKKKKKRENPAAEMQSGDAADE